MSKGTLHLVLDYQLPFSLTISKNSLFTVDVVSTFQTFLGLRGATLL